MSDDVSYLSQRFVHPTFEPQIDPFHPWMGKGQREIVSVLNKVESLSYFFFLKKNPISWTKVCPFRKIVERKIVRLEKKCWTKFVRLEKKKKKVERKIVRFEYCWSKRWSDLKESRTTGEGNLQLGLTFFFFLSSLSLLLSASASFSFSPISFLVCFLH